MTASSGKSNPGKASVASSSSKKNTSAASAASLPIPSGPPGKPIEIHPGHAGEAVVVEDLPKEGMLTLVFLYRDGYADAGYRSIVSKIDVLANNPSVTLYKINIGKAGSPFSKAYPSVGMEVPHLCMYGFNRSLYGAYNGHSIGGPIANPAEFFTLQLDKAKKRHPKLKL